MSRNTLERFDIQVLAPTIIAQKPAGDGTYVLAQHALDREAVLQAEIRTLELQLKESNELLAYIGKRARTTDYDGGWTGVWDVRGVPAWNDAPQSKFNHRTFIDAIKAEMVKDKK
jgi:hypothetical protein